MYLYVYIHVVRAYAYMCVCMCTYIYIRTNELHAIVRVFTCVCIHTHTHTYTRIDGMPLAVPARGVQYLVLSSELYLKDMLHLWEQRILRKHKNTCMCEYMYMYMIIHVRMCVCMHVCVHVCLYVCMYAHVCTRIHIYIIYIYAYIHNTHTYKWVHAYTYIRSHSTCEETSLYSYWFCWNPHHKPHIGIILCICTCVCACICEHVCIYIHIHARKSIQDHIPRVWKCQHVNIHIKSPREYQTYIRIYMHAYACEYVCMYGTHACACILHMYTCSCAHTYSYMKFIHIFICMHINNPPTTPKPQKSVSNRQCFLNAYLSTKPRTWNIWFRTTPGVGAGAYPALGTDAGIAALTWGRCHCLSNPQKEKSGLHEYSLNPKRHRWGASMQVLMCVSGGGWFRCWQVRERWATHSRSSINVVYVIYPSLRESNIPISLYRIEQHLNLTTVQSVWLGLVPADQLLPPSPLEGPHFPDFQKSDFIRSVLVQEHGIQWGEYFQSHFQKHCTCIRAITFCGALPVDACFQTLPLRGKARLWKVLYVRSENSLLEDSFLLALVMQEDIPPVKPTETGNKYMFFASCDVLKNMNVRRKFQNRLKHALPTGLAQDMREIHLVSFASRLAIKMVRFETSDPATPRFCKSRKSHKVVFCGFRWLIAKKLATKWFLFGLFCSFLWCISRCRSLRGWTSSLTGTRSRYHWKNFLSTRWVVRDTFFHSW